MKNKVMCALVCGLIAAGCGGSNTSSLLSPAKKVVGSTSTVNDTMVSCDPGADGGDDAAADSGTSTADVGPDASLVITCFGPGAGGAAGYANPPDNWSFNIDSNGMACGSVFGSTTCASCDLVPDLDDVQCTMLVGSATMMYDPVSNVVYVIWPSHGAWTPHCRG